MKRMFNIISKNDQGVVACITVETDAEWIPMNAEDIGKTVNFMPGDVYQIEIGDDLGHRSFCVQMLERRGFDRSPR